MTQPRRHLPGQVARVARRCSERRNFLRPDESINHAVSYEIGKAANRRSQQIYAVMALANRVIFVLGDTNADRSEFMRDTMSGIARSRNDDLERDESLWASGSYDDTVLVDRESIEEQLLECWLQPVREGLVDRVQDWPGFTVLPDDWGEPNTISKPSHFYGRESTPQTTLTPRPPPGFEDMTLAEVKRYFNQRIRRREKEILSQRSKPNSCVGADTIKAIDPFSSAKPSECPSSKPRPLAGKRPALLSQAYDRLHRFRSDYQTQRKRWLRSKHTKRQVQFPCGTVQLRRIAPISCKKLPDDEPGLFDLSRPPSRAEKPAA